MFSRCIPFFRKRNSNNGEINELCKPDLQSMPTVVMGEVLKNLNFRSIDPCQPNLQNMPKVVMEEVLKNLDIQSIFRLRKVCRDLRFSIDRIEPKLHVKRLSFRLPLTTKSLKSYTRDMSNDDRMCTLRCHKPRTGCKIEWELNGITKCLNISMEEADALLKNTKMILDELKINLRFKINLGEGDIEKMEEDFKEFYGTMKSLLKNKGQLLETKEVELLVHNQSEAAELLKCIDPKSLKTISIQYREWLFYEAIEMDFTELEAVEQWKSADTLRINGNYIMTPTESFASFKAVILWADVVSIVKLDEVKEFFIRSPKMETFTIESNDLERMEDQLISYFGQFDSFNEEFIPASAWRLRIRRHRRLNQRTWKWLKNSTEKFQIVLKIGYENHITFSKVKI